MDEVHAQLQAEREGLSQTLFRLKQMDQATLDLSSVLAESQQQTDQIHALKQETHDLRVANASLQTENASCKEAHDEIQAEVIPR